MTILIRRVVSVFDKKTTMRLTQEEWIILTKICTREKISRKNLLEMIDTHRDKKIGLTPAVRLFSLLYLYARLYKTPPFTRNIKNIISEM